MGVIRGVRDWLARRQYERSKKGTADVGRYGEQLAVNALRDAGYAIIARNEIIDRREIDIIAKEGDLLVFVEVKTRRDHAFGTPMEAVTRKTQERFRYAANLYLVRHKLKETSVRFDVVTIDLSDGEEKVEVVRGAF
ncbi:MAG: YraN family protein [Nitrospinae bacterium]|nr:YraN family protein [Nitrospinota bacterium]